MTPCTRPRAFLLALILVLALGGLARAEVSQRGDLRVKFEGKLTPNALPRERVAPVRVAVAAKIATTDGSDPPQLRRIAIAINRNGRLHRGGLPICHLRDIQPATTTDALAACRRSLVGEGSFSADVLLPEQAPFPSAGKVYAFNGSFGGHPAILAHVYGTEPAPTSSTIPFVISRSKGTYGSILTTSLPRVTPSWGYITGISIAIGRTFRSRHGVDGYLSAACPAPPGFAKAVFPLARASFSFAGGQTMTQTLTRSCRARG